MWSVSRTGSVVATPIIPLVREDGVPVGSVSRTGPVVAMPIIPVVKEDRVPVLSVSRTGSVLQPIVKRTRERSLSKQI